MATRSHLLFALAAFLTLCTVGQAQSAGSKVADHPNWKLLNTDTCGPELNKLSSRIFGGEEAELKEYPWLALLQYETTKGSHYLCHGALISTRYVLTGTICAGSKYRKLVSVRLGEHNTDTDPDCMGKVCADPVRDFNVSEIILHPQFSSDNRNKHHDIALIRLDSEVPITDYIAPICLPNGAAVTKRYEGDSLIVAGWGWTESRNVSNVKLWVQLPVVTNAACQSVYKSLITLSDNQMCAGGEEGKDTCRGDGGGPLMAVDSVVPGRSGGQWVIAGVVSIGPNVCGTAGRPGVYTRVGPYVQWILDTIKA